MKNPFLIGERIYLRPLEREDVPQLQTYINDPEVTRTLTAYRPINRAQEEAFIERIGKNENEVCAGIALRHDDKLIGCVGLHQFDFKNRTASFGLGIGAKEEWDKGYGTEATRLIVRYGFETLNLNRIALRVYAYNPRAIRTYEKAGFKMEGVLRQDCYRDGRYWDTHIMGILREEWNAIER